MIYNLEIDLMPSGIKKQIEMIRRVAIYTEIGAIAVLFTMAITGFFRDLATGIFFSSAILLITTPLLIPGFRFEKVSQSTVRFADDQIYVLDKGGVCWRTIDYNTITTVRVEEVAGFFYGHNKDMFRNIYVCVFLNGSAKMPQVPFAKLFVDKDFIMFGYHADALQFLQQKNAFAVIKANSKTRKNV